MHFLYPELSFGMVRRSYPCERESFLMSARTFIPGHCDLRFSLDSHLPELTSFVNFLCFIVAYYFYTSIIPFLSLLSLLFPSS